MSQRPNSPQFRNQVLAKLSLADLELLRPGLEPVQVDIRHSLEKANEPIRHVYFVESGFASVVAKDTDNHESEVGIVGREGVTGISVLSQDLRVDRYESHASVADLQHFGGQLCTIAQFQFKPAGRPGFSQDLNRPVRNPKACGPPFHSTPKVIPWNL